jgi:hypothetical protein
MKAIQLNKRQVLNAHEEGECKGEFCSIHRPSDHVMVEFPLYWRGDRGLMERICPHGIGHPDPDDLAFKKANMPNYENYAFGIHGCDGCCYDGRKDDE